MKVPLHLPVSPLPFQIIHEVSLLYETGQRGKHVLYEVQGLYILFVFQILQLAFQDHARASTPDTQVDDDPLPAESSSLPASCTTDDDPVPSPPKWSARNFKLT